MKKQVILLAITITISISVTVIIGWNMYLRNNRYHLVRSIKGIAYEIDKKTGKTWVIIGDIKKIHKESLSIETSKENIIFPSAQKIKVTGNARLRNGSFFGELYNGSNWTIKEVLFLVTVIEKNGSIRWARKFKDQLVILPLTTESFTVKVIGDENIGYFEWRILEIWGTKE